MTGLGFNRQIHRGTVADENRTTQVPGAPLPPPQSAVPHGTAVRSEEGAKKRRSNGKAPAAKARRDDPEAQLLTGFAPGQKEALQYAYTAFNSPSRRSAACRQLRYTGDYDPVLPLSPLKSKPCSTPEGCFCTISHRQLKNDLGLVSTDQVPPPTLAQRFELGDAG